MRIGDWLSFGLRKTVLYHRHCCTELWVGSVGAPSAALGFHLPAAAGQHPHLSVKQDVRALPPWSFGGLPTPPALLSAGPPSARPGLS